jgi:hypothetical protein
VCEALPLGLLRVGWTRGVGGVGPVDEPEVGGDEVEARGVGGGVILLEDTGMTE